MGTVEANSFTKVELFGVVLLRLHFLSHTGNIKGLANLYLNILIS